MSRDLADETTVPFTNPTTMRTAWVVAVAVWLMIVGSRECEATQPTPASKDTPAAERTRRQLLKTKVTVTFKGVPLREALKEFAAQVEMQAERHVMWTYTEGVPADKAISYSCKDKPLELALDELFKAYGLGYVVLSLDDQPRDGWVRITQGAERGYAAAVPPPPPGGDDEDEKRAGTRLGVAKELIEKGKTADAKAVLMLIITKFPKSKAAAEAKELLEKLGK